MCKLGSFNRVESHSTVDLNFQSAPDRSNDVDSECHSVHPVSEIYQIAPGTWYCEPIGVLCVVIGLRTDVCSGWHGECVGQLRSALVLWTDSTV